jgi:hypothetical protein
VADLTSPVIARTDPVMVAFRTKYGPNTSMLPVRGLRSYRLFPKVPLTRGCQTLGASQVLSASQTLVSPTVIRVRPDDNGVPDMRAVPLIIEAVTEEEPDIVGVKVELV